MGPMKRVKGEATFWLISSGQAAAQTRDAFQLMVISLTLHASTGPM